MNTASYGKQVYRLSLYVLIFLIIAAFSILTNYKFVSAAAVPESCFTFNSGTITTYDPNTDPLCLKDVDIPATIGGVGVTAIGDGAFSGKSLISVSFPEGITSIGNNGFTHNLLSSVSLPDSLLTIGGLAFQGNQITSVHFGNSLQIIGPTAFWGNKLTTIDLPDSLVTVGSSAFYGNQLKSLVLPENVTTLDFGSFQNNQIKSVVMGNKLLSIAPGWIGGNPLSSVTIGTNDYAGPANTQLRSGEFYNLPIASLVIGNSVSAIGGGAFGGILAEYVTLPESVTSLGASAFAHSHLKQITLNGDTVISGTPFDGVVSTTGEYIRLLTSDLSNPQGYVDLADTYIVNPAAVIVKYVDSHGNPLSPELYKTGTTLANYTVASNPTADFSLYYRSGETLPFSPPAVDGYNTPTDQSINLIQGSNTVTFVYYTPAEVAAMNQIGAPNTGLAKAISPLVYVFSGLVGITMMALLVARRLRANK